MDDDDIVFEYSSEEDEDAEEEWKDGSHSQ